MEERRIRLARLPAALRPVSIYTGDPPAPISCEWLGVAQVPYGRPAASETFILYFLNGNGEPQEALQYETLQIALDRAFAICGYPQENWTKCDIPVLDSGSYGVGELNSAMSRGE